jgi:hypothetical protein
MKRSCIVCGQKADSREHIFPAALGGRRVNKGIYCAKHNNQYSSVAQVIATQLAPFNSLLGIVNDHTGKAQAAKFVETATGKTIVVQAGKLRLEKPEVLSEVVQDGRRYSNIAVSDRKQADDWINAQKELGYEVTIKKCRRALVSAGNTAYQGFLWRKR